MPPTAASDRVCSTCGAGKYQVNDQCQPLTVCSSSQYESTPATALSDRKCSALTACQAGSKQTAEPTSTTDRQCAACSSGTFSTQVNASTCKAWTACTSAQTQSVAGSATTDIVCVDKPVCSTAKDRTCTTQCPCASAEGVCTASNQCLSGATCVAGSGKKVGRAGDTCLATHCNNDQADSCETSVDCGGECGCRATFEIVSYKGLPSGANGHVIATMSRDGKRLGGSIGGAQASYPGVVAYDGTVTELNSYGKGGAVFAASSDGSVMVGALVCTNPPSCTASGYANARWSGSAAPALLDVYGAGAVRAISSSGTIVAGAFYDSDTNSDSAFLFTGTQRILIPELTSVVALTPDGKYVAGQHKNGTQGGLWFAQTQVTTKIGAANWTSTSISGANGTEPAVIGEGYGPGDTITGFRWKGGTLTQLGLLAGGVYTAPYAVSSDGNTVVGLTGSNDFQQAFIWTESNKLRTIIDELKARGLEPAVDLDLPKAEFISDDGKTIVGQFFNTSLTFWRVVLD